MKSEKDFSDPVVVGITAGDAAGIGPEIIIKSLPHLLDATESKFVIYCRKNIFEEAYSLFKGSFQYELYTGSEGDLPEGTRIIVADFLQHKNLKIEYGKVSTEFADDAMKYVEMATRDAMSGVIDTMVTAPINKLGVHAAGYKEKGHTEFITGIAGIYEYAMMFVGGGIKVVLLTIHLPIKDVPSKITKHSVAKKIELTANALIKWFAIKKPRIAVCGLNPHSGEGGILGDEDEKEILPAVEEAVKKGISAFGPLPADTVFNRCKKGEFDVVIAMYHDQGLVPVKALSFGKGVNVTIGMPFIRTSPDHGTAYDIAGKGIADTGSMIESIKLAIELTNNHRIAEKNN